MIYELFTLLPSCQRTSCQLFSTVTYDSSYFLISYVVIDLFWFNIPDTIRLVQPSGNINT